jgi:hypothetical protein
MKSSLMFGQDLVTCDDFDYIAMTKSPFWEELDFINRRLAFVAIICKGKGVHGHSPWGY